jgi:phosphoglycerol transferase MdoB-like AlkP superfamily enzyme
MMGTLGLIGLIVIIIAWIIQLVVTVGKSKNLSLGFLWIYFVGVILLIISLFMVNMVTSAIFNIAIAVLVLIVALVYPKKPVEKKEEEPEKESQ